MMTYRLTNFRVGQGMGRMDRELGNNRGGDPNANVEAHKQAGFNSHFYVSPDTANNGRAGGAACASSR
ncbi:MAG TPA: hypothetical protein PLX89_18405 [Verrucomicrobiota bacterium]|nr:hypothetical protein [Verrucomicrobiota bacterium]